MGMDQRGHMDYWGQIVRQEAANRAPKVDMRHDFILTPDEASCLPPKNWLWQRGRWVDVAWVDVASADDQPSLPPEPSPAVQIGEQIMSEMVERVAQAIYKSLKGSLEASGLRPCLTDETEWREFIPDARAAIAEMRTPNGDMALAGLKLPPQKTDDELVRIWQAMIDAALK